MELRAEDYVETLGECPLCGAEWLLYEDARSVFVGVEVADAACARCVAWLDHMDAVLRAGGARRRYG